MFEDKLIKVWIGLALTLAAAVSPAYSDSSTACPSCPEPDRPAYPRSGLWYDADRSGSGVNFDIQNGIAAGTIYTYDGDGEAVWYLFSGELEAAVSESAAQWSLSADLEAYAEGSCLTCSYKPTDGGEAVGTIEIEFTGRNRLEYSIDGSQRYELRPFVFGAGLESFVPGYEEVLLPVFGPRIDFGDDGFSEGSSTPWVVIIGDPDGSMFYNTTERPRLVAQPQIMHVNYVDSRDGDPYEILFSVWSHPAEIYDYMRIVCGTKGQIKSIFNVEVLDHFNDDEAFCMVRNLNIAGSYPEHYFMPLDALGDDYFKATALTGETIEGMRLRNRQ